MSFRFVRSWISLLCLLPVSLVHAPLIRHSAGLFLLVSRAGFEEQVISGVGRILLGPCSVLVSGWWGIHFVLLMVLWYYV